MTVPDYDFKGNPLGSARQYTADPRRHPYWQTPVAMEEDGSGNPVLYTMSTVYDALSRPVTITTPEGGETQHTYNKTGLLQATDISGVHGLSDEVVLDTKYDAKSQRKKEQYGNGTTSTYEYDPSTLRVTRIRTTRHSDSKELQDLRYWYDPVGNVTLLKDLAQQEVYFANTVVSADRDCTYDALYRLIREEGRELIGNDGATSCNDGSRSGKTPIPFVNTVPPPSDAKALRRYTEHYSYDAVGNMTELDHDTGGTGSWTRTFTISSTSNHLTGCSIGSNDPLSETYNYDNRGNLVSGMNHFIAMNYNAENRLEEVTLTATISAFYQYDSTGRRVRKTIREHASVVEMRKYVGDWETYSKYTGGSLTLERESLHVSDDAGRILLVETQTDVGTPVPVLRYQYSNHLGSAALELDENGAIISYEEYYAYGNTSFQSGRSLAEVSLKRYRYIGAERDEESGFYYFGARYYIPWLCRWLTHDPINNEWYNLCKGQADKNEKRQFIELAASSYEYCYDNPVRFTDTGGEQVPPEQEAPVQETPSGNKMTVKEENDVKIPSTAQPPSQQSNPESNPQSGSELLNDAFIEFQKKFYSQEFKKAIGVIVDKYQLAEITKLMSYGYSPEMAESTVIETTGQEEIGYPQYTEFTHGDLKAAVANKTNFSKLVLTLTHEYIHGFQRGNLGMKDHAIREFMANQFSLFPNNSIIAREGILTFNIQFPEKVPAAQTFIWASNAAKYYRLMPKELQEKYKTDMSEIVEVGLAAYEKFKHTIHPDRAVDMGNRHKLLSSFNLK